MSIHVNPLYDQKLKINCAIEIEYRMLQIIVVNCHNKLKTSSFIVKCCSKSSCKLLKYFKVIMSNRYMQAAVYRFQNQNDLANDCQIINNF